MTTETKRALATTTRELATVAEIVEEYAPTHSDYSLQSAPRYQRETLASYRAGLAETQNLPSMPE